MEETTKKEETKNWLNKLQQESWQLELLISGFAILGLFELQQFLNLELRSVIGRGASGVLIAQLFLLIVGIIINSIFLINLIIHMCVRGLWIGAIGLRYVSGDIDYEALKYNIYFTKYLKRSVGSFDQYIISLEKFASIIFSFTFLLGFVFFSLFLFLFEVFLIFYLLKEVQEYFDSGMLKWIMKIIIFFIFSISTLMIIDFLTLGFFKKIKQRHFAKFFLFFFQIIGKMTLAFAWRPILLNFLDQKYTRKLLVFILPYILILYVLSGSGITTFSYFPIMNPRSDFFDPSHQFGTFAQYYDDERKPIQENMEVGGIKIFSIPSFKVSKNTFECFIRYNSDTEKFIQQQNTSLHKLQQSGFYFYDVVVDDDSGNDDHMLDLKLDSLTSTFTGTGKIKAKKRRIAKDSLHVVLKKQKAQKKKQNLLNVRDLISKSIILTIDGEVIPRDSIHYFFHKHPYFNEEGMRCFFPIHFEAGMHDFGYKKVINAVWNENVTDTLSYSIPFMYE